MQKSSKAITKIPKIVALLTGTCMAFLISSGAIAKDASKEKVNSEVIEAREMLNSWSGQHEILEQAHEKLIHDLDTNPRDYFALKEIARYQIMNGYMYDHLVQNGGLYTYAVGVYAPNTLEQAEATIRTAIRINPHFAEGYVLLGHILFEQNKLDESGKALTQAETLGTSDPWLHLNWAALHNARGEDSAATARWEKVLKSGTSNTKAITSAYSFLIKKYEKAGKHEKVIRLYKKQIKHAPTDAWIRGNFADYLTGTLGRNDEAISQARSALQIMDYGIGRQILAMALYRKWADMMMQKNESNAEKYFQEAFGLYPELNNVMSYGASMPAGEHLAKALISKKGISIDSTATEGGATALLLAVNNNRARVVELLLSLKANPNISDKNGWTPLLGAADEGNYEIVKMLLARGANLKATLPPGGIGAVYLAERKNHMELATWLKKRIAEIK